MPFPAPVMSAEGRESEIIISRQSNGDKTECKKNLGFVSYRKRDVSALAEYSSTSQRHFDANGLASWHR
jgi:hypothetical protein